MKKKMRGVFAAIISITALFAVTNTSLNAKVLDSIGTKVRNGKVYIVHEVDKGQGIYTVAKRYGVTIDQLQKENPGADKGLFLGQLIYVPTGKDAPFEEPVVKEYFKSEKKTDTPKQEEKVEKTTFAEYHTVEAGETLFGIAKKYNTTVEVLRGLNSLPSDELSIGSKLIVPAGSKTAVAQPDESKAQKPNEIKPDKKEDIINVKEQNKNAAEKTDNDLDEIKKKYNKPKAEPEPGKLVNESKVFSKKVENMPEFNVEKVTESGMAEVMVIDYNGPSKNIAYHYEAPVNTIIMVTNPVNNKTVFVKVVGSLNISNGSDRIIGITKTALEQIGLPQGGNIELSYAR